MDVQFVASVAPIVRDADASRSFYRDALGLSFEGEEGDYLFTHNLDGTKHFGLWPLRKRPTPARHHRLARRYPGPPGQHRVRGP